MGYSYAYEVEEFLELGLMPILLSWMSSLVWSIAAYVLTSLALYTIAERRGLNNPWLAWIPVANVWLVGSISDQYRYVVKGENRSRRKFLLALKILSALCRIALVCLAVVVGARVISGVIHTVSDEQLIGGVMGPVIGMLGVCVPLVGISIAQLVIRYMAMYDIYTSLDPRNSIVFLVLSILFRVTEPFFLFFSRNKDAGMPPRKQQPVYHDPVYEQPEEEPWNNSETDDL